MEALLTKLLSNLVRGSRNSVILLMCDLPDLPDALYRGIITSKNNRSRISII